MNDLKLILVDRSKGLVDAWEKAFADLPNVTIRQEDFYRLREYDCVITPGNSFGIMDGGFDYIIVEKFGFEVQQRVQRRIIADYLGELPVGDCIVVETNNSTHPFVAYAPTMRVPMDIDKTDYAYTSLWAALTAIHRHNHTHDTKIERVVCTGMGTGTGRIPYGQAAYHMAQAWKHFLEPPTVITWDIADNRHYHIEFVGKHQR
jgi:O-acetyl-ADP-ribose deacetylase (regulator of RNase III)